MRISWRRYLAFILRTFSVVTLLLGVSVAVIPQPQSVTFEAFLEKRLSSTDTSMPWALERFCPVSTDIVAKRVLHAYGSMFVAHESVSLPPACVQPGEFAVISFQKGLNIKGMELSGAKIELQVPAADALQRAIDEVAANGHAVTPLDGSIAGRRSYGDTLMLWNSRFFPAMEFWHRRGRLSSDERDSILRLDLQKKIEKVIELESRGMFFSTNRTRSIFTSTAPPGTSQHLALIAFDVVEYWNPAVRQALNRNGWYQTIVDDAPHFTYIGVPETELPGRGLMAVAKGGFLFWIPRLSPAN